jgi:hypothetical protein
VFPDELGEILLRSSSCATTCSEIRKASIPSQMELEGRSVSGASVTVVAQPKGMPSELVVNTSEALQRLTTTSQRDRKIPTRRLWTLVDRILKLAAR